MLVIFCVRQAQQIGGETATHVKAELVNLAHKFATELAKPDDEPKRERAAILLEQRAILRSAKMLGSRALEASPTPPAPSSARGPPAGLIFGAPSPFSPSAFPRGKPPNCGSPAPSSSRNRRTHHRLEFSET